MDLYDHVRKDQSLNSAVKSFKLKTLAEWFGIPAKKVKYANMNQLINTPELREYLESDLNITQKLFEIYLPLQVRMAEFMKMPLDSIINSNPSFIPRIFSARQLFMRKYVPFNTNVQRYGIENAEGKLEMEKFEAIQPEWCTVSAKGEWKISFTEPSK